MTTPQAKRPSHSAAVPQAKPALRPPPSPAPKRVASGGRDRTLTGSHVAELNTATPLGIVEMERRGVPGSLVKEMAVKMAVPAVRMFSYLGIPKATVEKKAAGREMIAGSGGQAALGMVRLLAIAQAMVQNSDAPEAKGFDSAKWLGQWIERPQPALGGRRPAELLDTPTGTGLVARLLGAIESGTYQ